jgi:hypothetical protein
MENLTEPTEQILNRINFIHEVKIYNELQNHHKILIFDLRDRDLFTNSHICYALNIPQNEHSVDFYTNPEIESHSAFTTSDELKSILKSYKRYYIVIIMSEQKIKRKHILSYHSRDESPEKDIIRKSLLLYEILVRNKVREIGLYNMGFSRFAAHYYFIITRGCIPPIAKYLSTCNVRDIANFPSEIFDHRIYIGTQRHVLIGFYS